MAAAEATGMPPATVQLIYRTSHDDGERLVSDPRIGATGYTGSRSRGPEAQSRRRQGRQADLSGAVERQPGRDSARRARRAARRHRRPVHHELPDGDRPVLHESGPGDPARRTEDRAIHRRAVVEKFKAAPVGTLLSAGVAAVAGRRRRHAAVGRRADARRRQQAGGGKGYSHANTLLRVSGQAVPGGPEALQTEAFGNASLLVVADDIDEAARVVEHLEGNLTGCIYSHTQRQRRRGLRAGSRRAAAQGRPAAQRQDADRRRRQPGDESRRTVPGDRPSRLHGRRHSRRRSAASRCWSATTTCGNRGCLNASR